MRKTKASIMIITATAITVATLFLLPYTPKIAVSTARITRGDLVLTTLLEGTVINRDEQPCLALQSGQVSGIYVENGQRVSAGELLFSLDSSYEQSAIATLSGMIYQQEEALAALPHSETVAAACAQGLMSLRAQLEELRASVELKQIRAESDGIIGGVYVREGDRVSQGAMLGLMYSEGKQLSALCRASDAAYARRGTPANLYDSSGRRLGLAELSLMGAPSLSGDTAKIIQTLSFTPIDEALLADTDIGDTVTVELLSDVLYGKALAPIGAIGEGNTLWLVKDGRAMPVKLDALKRNDSHVTVPEQYIGCAVILTPDAHELYTGCPVKEHKTK